MHYRVFFYFGASGAQISSAKAVEMSLEDISEKLLERLVANGDYFGLIDDQDQVLQIAREAGERYWVELPLDAARASFGCHLDLAGLEELLQRLPERFERSAFPELQYRPW
jgi:hypothetical protein